MGGLEWVVLSAFILLAVALFYLKKKAKLKTGQAVKGRGAATTAKVEALPTKTGAPQIQPSRRVTDLAEARILGPKAVHRPVDKAIAKPQVRVLVVDGDPETCDLLTTEFNLSGFSSKSCTNGEAALKLLSTEGFDAVISDLNIPGVSGLQLLEATRRLAPRTAFLMATSVGDVALGKSAMKQGAADYILKPFQMEAVMASLVRALGMKRLEAELAEYRKNLENMGSIPLRAELSAIAAPELGIFPAMTADKEGILITREEDGHTVPTYVFKPPSEWPKEQVVEFAARVLKVRPLTGEWLIGAGFKRFLGSDAVSKPVDEPIAKPQLRILVVDDDPIICDLLTTKLNLSGFSAQSCTSGEAALKLLSMVGFDAIISDLNMPGISGLQLLEATRRLAPRTAFLMATGVGDVAVGISAMKQGAADYILKPFQMEAVIVSLWRALETKRMEAELAEYRQNLENSVEHRTNQRMAATRKIELPDDETLEALAAALDLRDNDTAGHSRRVTFYTLEMARRLNFSPTELKQLERGAYLHDIGKIGIPDSILLKPDRLTPEETLVMQSHVRIGYELMSRVAFLSVAALIVRTHHERYDGSGYPQGLAGDEIPLGARIVAVANAFDAMRSDWPYRRGQPYSVVRAEIQREAGKQFDPKVVEVFLSIPEETWEKISAEAAVRSGERRASIANLTFKEDPNPEM
jgi:putative nucleotidyltransferase with HDIG domain